MIARLLILLILGFAESTPAEQGTLTLKDDNLEFCAGDQTTKYELLKPKGFKILNYEKKLLVSDNRERDVSEIKLDFDNGQIATLVERKPIKIERTTDGTSTRWALR